MPDALVSGLGPAPSVRLVPSRGAQMMRIGMVATAVFFAIALVAPLAVLLWKSFEAADGRFVFLANYVTYFTTPALLSSAWNSFWTAALTVVIVVPLAFTYAYAMTRSTIPGRAIFRTVALLPILAPSLLPALALIYLFGNQGMLRWMLDGGSIYGAAGIVAAQVFYTFPHAVLILSVALAIADSRLYEAAQALRASRLRVFRTVTLPGARFGLISAGVVVFTLVVTDFGIPKVIGGRFNVLATDVYKQVVGQHDFNMGAVVGMILLLPAVGAFLLERWAQRQQTMSLSGRAVPLTPKQRRARDLPLLAVCLLIAFLIVGIVGVAIWGSLIKFWPYDLSLTLANYDFANFDSAGWRSFWVSIEMAAWTAILGTGLVFVIAYLLERGPNAGPLAMLLRIAISVPLAVPGLVLGLAYIMFFNEPLNPLSFFYGTLAILVLNSITHFYTVCHLTATTAIRQLDPEFEAVTASLRVPVWRTFLRVTVPICLPAILEILVYLFVNAMTTVSAVIFLYGPDSKPASVAVVHMDEAGQVSAAAAMAVIILGVTMGAKISQVVATGLLDFYTQGWRRR